MARGRGRVGSASMRLDLFGSGPRRLGQVRLELLGQQRRAQDGAQRRRRALLDDAAVHLRGVLVHGRAARRQAAEALGVDAHHRLGQQRARLVPHVVVFGGQQHVQFPVELVRRRGGDRGGGGSNNLCVDHPSHCESGKRR
eukprot:CAMPEP_0197604974 /NCGR_PEP_ID=MMETSP1326-20131121/42222_1 /TAXON_ID=1155430 /ORGANISM="Genus nov. species nov., Strain RCC2288" /LENGTH=140 /DNA_ID=CAMNT_0043172715 /DNA_START=389 /DNA_END=808 /DNA_ORIENTATION=+